MCQVFLVHSDDSFLSLAPLALRHPLGIPEVDTPTTRLLCYIGFIDTPPDSTTEESASWSARCKKYKDYTGGPGLAVGGGASVEDGPAGGFITRWASPSFL